MLRTIHASGASLAHSLCTRLGLALAAAPAFLAPCCDSMYAETTCVKAAGVDISCSGGITTGALTIDVADIEGCPLIASAQFVSFNNRDGQPGFDPNGGDILVNALMVQSSPPTTHINMGQFSSGSSDGTITGTNWQLNIGNADGTNSVFSGTF